MINGSRRLLNATQCAIGLATLVRPRAIVTLMTPRGSTMPDPRIVRVLGARQFVQGALGLMRPTGDVALLGSVVDGLHALSLIPVIAFSSKYRASAAASAGLATAAALAGVGVSRRG